MYEDDDLLQLSGLQHLAYCERQWALIHLEGQWAESSLTADGRILHERTDSDVTEVRGDRRIARGLRIRSLRLGLVGRTDVVEFHRLSETEDNSGAVRLQESKGMWRPYPVEYKRGQPKPDHRDAVQLCAQALCLEEMLDASIPQGALYYGMQRRRSEVGFDTSLRGETENLAGRMHKLSEMAETPPPANNRARCRNCSLKDICLPKAARRRSVKNYITKQLETP